MNRVMRVLAAGVFVVALSSCGADTSTGDNAGAPQQAGATGPTGKWHSASTAGSYDPNVDKEAVLAPVRAFVDAVAAKNADQLLATFTDDGVVIDVSRRIEGHDAIRRWAENETLPGKLTVLQIVETADSNQRLLVRFAAGGSGGFEAHYTFATEGDLISELDMQYA